MVESQETAASEPLLFEALTSHHRLNSTPEPFSRYSTALDPFLSRDSTLLSRHSTLTLRTFLTIPPINFSHSPDTQRFLATKDFSPFHPNKRLIGRLCPSSGRKQPEIGPLDSPGTSSY